MAALFGVLKGEGSGSRIRLRGFREKGGGLASAIHTRSSPAKCQGRLRLRDLDFWRGAINLRSARAMIPAEHPGNALRTECIREPEIGGID
jgi:hypothetical protein